MRSSFNLGDLSNTTPFADAVLGWRAFEFRFRESVAWQGWHDLRTSSFRIGCFVLEMA